MEIKAILKAFFNFIKIKASLISAYVLYTGVLFYLGIPALIESTRYYSPHPYISIQTIFFFVIGFILHTIRFLYEVVDYYLCSYEASVTPSTLQRLIVKYQISEAAFITMFWGSFFFTIIGHWPLCTSDIPT